MNIKNCYVFLFLILFFSCGKNNDEYTELEKKFKGAFWNVDSHFNDLTYYDSAQLFLNRMKKNEDKEYLNNIWQLRLYLKKGMYDSILLKSKLTVSNNSYDINLINGIAYKAKGDTVNANIFFNKTLSGLNCNKELSDQCIIVKTLITDDFNLINENKNMSPFLYEIYNNSDNDIEILIEMINSPFNDDFFILSK